MLQECYDLLKKEKELTSSSIFIEKVSLMSFNATILQQLKEQTLRNFILEDSISKLQVQVSSLQVSTSFAIQALKESFEGKAFALFGGLIYFILTVKLVKVLLPRQGFIIPECLAKFENMNVAPMVCADLKLKRFYDQGLEHVPLGVSPSGVEEGSSNSWDFEDSAGAIHSGNNSTNATSLSFPR
ncbi:hypothetical protein SLA2020_234310 [Shorea laevis]